MREPISGGNCYDWLTAEKRSTMKPFECQNCGRLLHFENTRCENCGLALGYLPAQETVTALIDPSNEGADHASWGALAEPTGRYRFCANAAHGTCNWLVDDGTEELYCGACRHNRTIPDLSIPDNLARWYRIEAAKHRLFYTLLKLHLPLQTRVEDPENGLAFDFVSSDALPLHGEGPVMTGHANGVITISLAEADDAERERIRSVMGEPYRTLLGHFRHEIAHYYWDRLIAGTPWLDTFRETFGDERADYGAALQRHYQEGPPSDWPDAFVSAYASAHPWEDFAETWAHYFHMIDTLETARGFGLSVRPRVANPDDQTMVVDFDPHRAEMSRIIDAWLPLTVAINAVNRSMGLADLYPFVLTPSVIVKLTFVHTCIHTGIHAPSRSGRGQGDADLKAIVAGLRRDLGTPNPV